VQGIEERGVLPACDGVLSGYMGSAEIGEAILDAVARVKTSNPAARYCCDPVIGDRGRGVFVRAGIPEFMRERALPAADLVTPNHFELDYLSARESKTIQQAVHACGALQAMGPKTVLVTSLHVEDTPNDAVDLLACGPDGQFRLRTPLLELAVNGAGDAIAALFFLHLLKTGSTAAALSQSASSIFGLLRRTQEAGAREILLVEAQEEIVRPSKIFPASSVA
jgi:pyridoxine kinase